jgi:U3 small nucleolar RNA-associated protein 21
LDFSPDGRWIISVALDSTLRTWDLPTGGCIDGVVLPIVATSVKFSPLGDVLATTHVSGNGISLWTNRAQFRPVSTRHVEEEEFATILLPNASGDGGSTMLDGALDDEDDNDDNFSIAEIYDSVSQIDESLVTLSTGPRSKFNTLLHLDTMREKSKPKESQKKPEKAPFFLQLTGLAVGDRASVAEGKVVEQQKEAEDEGSKLRKLDANGNHSFESEFTKLLREAGEQEDYTEFLTYLLGLSPAVLDLEIRSINSFPPLTEMINFIRALNYGLKLNMNFEILETLYTMFFKIHADVIHQYEQETELHDALEEYSQLNAEMSEKMDALVKYCSGIVNFIS